jgi:hypothetical protein
MVDIETWSGSKAVPLNEGHESKAYILKQIFEKYVNIGNILKM